MLMDMFSILWGFQGDLQGTTGLLRPRPDSPSLILPTGIPMP